MVKKFTIPFASQGDANDIPDALQVDGKVSFTQGFGYDYERPYDDPQAKDIAREDMNGLFKAITSAVGELQTLGASEWSDAISYPKGAIVYYEKDLYISQVDDNQNKPPQNWVSITSIANDSLKKAANLSDLTNKATARNNLGLGSSATLNKTDVLGTSTSLVATQKLVNDTKINLESSKQDKLEFVGSGKVMREGASVSNSGVLGLNTNDKILNYIRNNTGAGRIVRLTETENLISPPYSAGITGKASDTWFCIVLDYRTATPYFLSGNMSSFSSSIGLTDKNVLQSTGSSTTNVMSQKAVTDQLNAIKSGHGLGYGQTWVDVKSQRTSGTIYTNSTGKPIMVSAGSSGRDSTALGHVDGVLVGANKDTYVAEHNRASVIFIVPANSKYKIDLLNHSGTNVNYWSELR